jgi:hypothetical protein
MSRRFASKAEYYRHHKVCFDLAVELGVTPREAELELERREIRARFDETHTRYLAQERPLNAGCETSRPVQDEPWMMRD